MTLHGSCHGAIARENGGNDGKVLFKSLKTILTGYAVQFGHNMKLIQTQ
jgi:hypothetical protein